MVGISYPNNMDYLFGLSIHRPSNKHLRQHDIR